jgi:hypothetical protein
MPNLLPITHPDKDVPGMMSMGLKLRNSYREYKAVESIWDPDVAGSVIY